MEKIEKKARRLAEVSHFFLSRQDSQDTDQADRVRTTDSSSPPTPLTRASDNRFDGGASGPVTHEKSAAKDFCKTFEQSALGIIWLNRDRIVQHVNAVAQQFLTVPDDAMHGQLFNFFIQTDETVLISIFRKNRRAGVGEMHMMEMEYNGETTYLLSIRDVTKGLKKSDGKVQFPLSLTNTHSALPII